MTDRLIRIVGLCGSLRAGSHSRKALEIALRAAAEAGAETILFDPAERPLPFCEGPATPPEAANQAEWSRLVKQADGLILSTPEYHGSFSGVMKNALDLVGIGEMEDKVCGLISVLGGGPQANALSHLRVVCRQVHAWVIPHQAAIGSAYRMFDGDGALKDEKLQRRVERVGTDVVKYARLIRAGLLEQTRSEND